MEYLPENNPHGEYYRKELREFRHGMYLYLIDVNICSYFFSEDKIDSFEFLSVCYVVILNCLLFEEKSTDK